MREGLKENKRVGWTGLQAAGQNDGRDGIGMLICTSFRFGFNHITCNK